MTLPPSPVPTSPLLSRRRFLIGAGALGAAGVAGVAVGSRSWSALPSIGTATASVRAGHGKLVLVTLYGGNDGLNTVVPAGDSAYRAGRSTLGYQPDELLALADGLGLNPKLTGMKALWDAKQLAVVRGVGYPNPSLSHFQSMDIWQTANLEGSGSGWLGRWLDATGHDPMRAISVGSALPIAMRGARAAATAVTADTITLPGGGRYQSGYDQLAGNSPTPPGLGGLITSTDEDLLKVKADLDRLHASGSPASSSSGASPGDRTAGAAGFAEQLGVVSALIKADAPTQVYQVSMSSFDTHSDEKTAQEDLLGELDAGISGFFAALKGSAQESDVVVMTYSEFGRRVAQNASGGTDHGTASLLFVAGPAVKGGQFYGEEPSLSKLDPNGDLVFNVDFRSVYATVLDRVVGVDPKSFLGASYPTLNLV